MDTILFDLDGTLIPMVFEEYMAIYMDELGKKCAAYGYDPDTFREGMWKATGAMIRSEGSRLNEHVFWDVFAGEMGEDVRAVGPELESFYDKEFHAAKAGTRPNPLAAPLIHSLRQKGYTLVLATNAVFPPSAYRARLSWVGLTPEDFDYISTYSNSHFCKPSTAYYAEILAAIGKQPQNCLMVGNDIQEDAVATQLGIPFYLITDDVINRAGADTTQYTQSSFAAFCNWANKHL